MSSSSEAALWITSERPDPRLSGGNIRQHHILRALAEQVPTDLLLVGDVLDDAPIRPALRRVHEVAAVPREHPTSRGKAWALNAYLAAGGGPREVYNHRPTLQAIRRFLADAGDYRTIVVEHAFLAPVGGFLPPGARGVITLHNVASEAAAQEAALHTGRQRFLAEREVAAWRRLEERVHDEFEVVVTVSDTDASFLRRPTVVVPNGVDCSRFPDGATARSEARVLFLGHLNFPPNIDGLDWMAAEIWPRVRQLVPTAALDVVGRDPHPRVEAAVASMAAAELHPSVPSVDPYLAQAAMSVVPLRFGTGTRLKALEALAAGVPLVGTRVGLDGLGIVDGTHALVRDTPDGIAEAIAKLANDSDLRQSLAAAGVRHARSHFDWGPLGRRFVDAALGRTT